MTHQNSQYDSDDALSLQIVFETAEMKLVGRDQTVAVIASCRAVSSEDGVKEYTKQASLDVCLGRIGSVLGPTTTPRL